MGEGRFARARNSGEADEEAEWQVGIELFQIVACGAANREYGFATRSAFGGHRDEFFPIQPASGFVGSKRFFGFDFGAVWRALIDDVAAVLACAWAEVDEMIGGAHHRVFVFDHHQRVSLVAQAVHDADEAIDVAGVEAYGWFVEHEERAGERGTKAGREVDAFDFAAGECASLTIEREVAEPNFDQIAEARGDFRQHDSECGVGGIFDAVGRLELFEQIQQFADR